MDSNVAVLIAMIVLMVGGAIFLNFQIKHQERKERMKQSKNVKTASSAPSKRTAAQN